MLSYIQIVLKIIGWCIDLSKMNQSDKEAFYTLVEKCTKKYGMDSAIASDILDQAEKNLDKPKDK